MAKKRYVILDRDGTIIHHYPYFADADKVELIPGAAKGVMELNRMGFGVVVVTNQSGIGRGYFKADHVQLIHEKLSGLLKNEGAIINDYYYCPHQPENECSCRKPRPGLVREASLRLGFDPGKSIVVGDNICDILLGKNIRAKTILVKTGLGSDVIRENIVRPDFVATNLLHASRLIMKESL